MQCYWACEIASVDWWADVNKSGGQLVEQITHFFDIMRYLFGSVGEVQAYVSYGSNYNIARSSVVNLLFENGCIGNLVSSNLATDEETPWLNVHLENEIIHIRSWNITFKKTNFAAESYSGFDNGMKAEQRIFLDCLLNKAKPDQIKSNYADAVASLKLSLAVSYSHRTGRPVKLDSFEG